MNLNRKQVIRVGFIVLSSFMVLACGDKSKKLTNQLNDAVSNVSASSEDETKKYNAYIEFYNQYLTRSLNGGINGYLNRAGDQETVVKNESSLYFSGHYSWSKIESAVKSKPSMKELDAAAEQLIPICKELSNLLVSAEDYYEAKDYLDDKYARGQELHTKILGEIKKYDQAYAKFDLALRNKEIETRDKEIEQAKKKGNEITYNRIMVLSAIDRIMSEISAQKLNASNVITADLSKIKPLYEEFNKLQKVLREKAQDEEMLKKEGYDSFNKTYLKTYISKTTDFKTGILDFIERVEKKEPVSDFRLKHNMMLDSEKGTPENLSRLRDEVISSYNSIR